MIDKINVYEKQRQIQQKLSTPLSAIRTLSHWKAFLTMPSGEISLSKRPVLG
ncbi:hypothetical protein IV39_GL000747 [Lactiplantibacillus plantarum]|nr:hypothetical protein IV39_GL000747 [Lactiplantibacillus plantarum]